ncbi:ABC transporter ATP-binding protein [Pelagicoccus sp. SDUM812005]|uniref:ABC transporter ATP-binding protein n=1 Tax=Pelagicoccus sp. SDUM812005 TaxID=3041257 RepID=UPI00280E711E|nr:ABC transporter ATP-binding protein [Pelagicoccus sp. SDUM812005]MDQ8183254.1 ABC transporter ATP-binding protein [Pelagicoccus sp. SDUM812005]
MKTIWRVSSYLFRYKWMFWGTIALAIGSTLSYLLVPKVAGAIVARLEEQDSLDGYWVLVGVLVGCFALREILNSLRIRVNNVLEQKVLIDLRRDLHAKLLDLPVRYFDTRKSGDIASRVIEDVQNVERVILDGTEQGSTAMLTLLGVTGMMFFSEPRLAALMILPIPVMLVLSRLHFKSQSVNWRKVREASGELSSLLIEDIQGNRLINSFALKGRERQRFDDKADELRRYTLKGMFRWSLHGPVNNFIVSLGTVAVIGYGGYLTFAEAETFTNSDLVEYLLYCYMLYAPLSLITSLNNMLATGKASAERVFDLLDFDVDIQDPDTPKPFPKAPLKVQFDSVDFKYSERATLLSDFSLIMPEGKVTALVGHTGAGKSTVANLLQRYYDVSEGSVTIGGVDVRDLTLQSLRSNIGMVSQDPFLFDGSVRDNLLLAREDATEEDLVRALEGACAWEFVSKLPDGMDTLIGERGIRLSMGEKQRITIARVILRNPPLVILDEATSAVDTLTEAKIQAAVDNLVKERTTLVIAHRLSTVLKADKIVVLDQGRIIETGTHDELIHIDGHYANLWKVQTDLIAE